MIPEDYTIEIDLTNQVRNLIHILLDIIKQSNTPGRHVQIEQDKSMEYSKISKGLNNILEVEGYSNTDKGILNIIRTHFLHDLKIHYSKQLRSPYT